MFFGKVYYDILRSHSRFFAVYTMLQLKSPPPHGLRRAHTRKQKKSEQLFVSREMSVNKPVEGGRKIIDKK